MVLNGESTEEIRYFLLKKSIRGSIMVISYGDFNKKEDTLWRILKLFH